MRIGRRRGCGINSIERGIPRRQKFPLLYWHIGAIATLVSTKVSGWPDQSGSGLGISPGQSNDTFRPVYTLVGSGGRPELTFDGVDDRLDASAFVLQAQPVTRIFAAKVTVVANPGCFIDVVSAPRQQIAKISNNVLRIHAASSFDTSYAWNANPHVVSAVINGASSRSRIDGVAMSTGNANTNGFSSLRYGVDLVSSTPLTGTFSESLAFGADLPVSNCRRVERRLAALYGVAMPV